jgi:hypothetical protein
LSVLAVVGSWRLFRDASKASQAAALASLAIEELARRVGSVPQAGAESAELAQLRGQAEILIDQQARLQEMARNLLDASAMAGGPSAGAVGELESAVTRLDATVGQMATALANLIQLLERQQARR